MKKLLFITLIALSFLGKAQTITIGEGTGMSQQVPYNSFYNYSFTEQLFLASEIQYAGYLKAVSFRIAYSYNTEAVNDINVYVKNVSRNEFADAFDYEPVSSENLVFSGTWTIPANVDNWITIEFDTPFYYNGTDNLLIAIDENSADYAMRYFRYSDVTALSLGYSSDNDNPNPYDLSAFTGNKEVLNQRANTKLVFDYTADVDENSVTRLSVYPNPAKDVLHIYCAEGETVIVFDAAGRLVMQQVYAGQIDVRGLEKGVYAVKTANGIVKFVKY